MKRKKLEELPEQIFESEEEETSPVQKEVEETEYFLEEGVEQKIANFLEQQVTSVDERYPTPNHLYNKVEAICDPSIKEVAPAYNPTLILRNKV